MRHTVQEGTGNMEMYGDTFGREQTLLHHVGIID